MDNDRRLNVLLITYSFPPAGGVGVLRALSLAKYLPENGVHLDVLTARNAAAVGRDPVLAAQVPASVAVHRTWTLDLPFDLRKAIKKAVTRGGAAKAGVAGGAAKPNPLKAALRDLIGNLLLPDPQVGWLPFAMRAARRLVARKKIDVVVVTVPPFSSVRLVTRLRRVFPRLPLVLDFRDEWLTTTIHLVSFNNNARARSVAEKAEREAVRDATAVVCVTEAAVAELQLRYPGMEAKFHCIPNGFDSAVRSGVIAPAGPDEPVTLTYLGTVYGSTDPSSVVEAVLRLPAEIRAKLRFRFIGHIENAAYRETLLRLGETVELVGFLPQAEALRSIEETTYLLLITHDPINVSAKLYDYLGSGRPILAAVHPRGDVRRILERTRAGWAADAGNVDAVEQLLRDAVARVPKLGEVYSPDAEAIAAYQRKPLAARYAALLKTVAAGAAAEVN